MFVFPEIAAEYELVVHHLKAGTKPDDYLECWKQALVKGWELQDGQDTNEDSDAFLFSDLMVLANEYSKLVTKEEAFHLVGKWRSEFKFGGPLAN